MHTHLAATLPEPGGAEREELVPQPFCHEGGAPSFANPARRSLSTTRKEAAEDRTEKASTQGCAPLGSFETANLLEFLLPLDAQLLAFSVS